MRLKAQINCCLFCCRSRILLLVRRTCLPRRRCWDGRRRRPTNTQEWMWETSLSPGEMGWLSMPSFTETGDNRVAYNKFYLIIFEIKLSKSSSSNDKKRKCRHHELVFANHIFHSLQINCLLDFKLVLYFSLVNTLSWLLRAKIFQILGSDHSDHVNLNGHQENCMQSAAKIHIWNIMSACLKFGESWNEKFSNMNDVVTILVIFYNYHLILAAIANIHICVYYHLITGVTYSQELSRPTIITWS